MFLFYARLRLARSLRDQIQNLIRRRELPQPRKITKRDDLLNNNLLSDPEKYSPDGESHR